MDGNVSQSLHHFGNISTTTINYWIDLLVAHLVDVLAKQLSYMLIFFLVYFLAWITAREIKVSSHRNILNIILKGISSCFKISFTRR